MSVCKNYCEKYGDWGYLVFRVLVGLFFFLHGWQKFAGGNTEGWFGVAGALEIVIGVFLVVGFFTRLGAVVGALEMLVAYFMVHASNGWNPLVNQGELALLFFAAFLVAAKLGNGSWSLEQQLLNKETF